ncbi:MAG: AAA family ATPase, partial [Nocardiopsis sp. BM-2018]
DGIDTRWRTEAIEAGFGPDQLDTLLRRTAPSVEDDSTIEVLVGDRGSGTNAVRRIALDELPAVVAERLAEIDSVVDETQVMAAIATLAPGGMSVALVEALTHRVLSDVEFVSVPGGPDGVHRWTTRTILDAEERLHEAFTSRSPGGAVVDEAEIAAAVGRTGSMLGPDQVEAVRRLCSDDGQLQVVVGRAGTGKTFAMAAVAEVYHRVGCPVVGVAPSALAARSLSAGAGIEAFTLPRFHRHAAPLLTDRHVVIVDEAAMVGTLELDRLVTEARGAGAKIVLVGDHHQLPEIGAGGGFAAAVNAIGDRGCELTVNRRQRADWERAALDQLRHGDVESAYRAYRDHDRVTVCATHDELHQRIADEWAESTWWDVETLIVAGTRTEARLLNDRARAAAERLGRLSGPPLTVAGRSFRVGDEVILTRNDPSQTDLGTGGRRRVDNGTRGRITEISPDGRVDVITAIGEHIRLDPAYLGAGYLDHGYAVTIHKSQGITCDKVLVAGPRG